MINYSLILSKNYIGKSWLLNNDDYSTLQWLNDSPKPTQAELDALWESTQAQIETEKAQAESIKASALAKLAALGLTQDEVKALVG
jgi:hypothetical protein